jgi:hypothetical protein
MIFRNLGFWSLDLNLNCMDGGRRLNPRGAFERWTTGGPKDDPACGLVDGPAEIMV